MDVVWTVGSVAGALGAACIAWVVGRARLTAVGAREQAGREVLRAALEERLRAREEELIERTQELETVSQRAEALAAARATAQAELAAERAARAQEQQATEEKLLLVQQSQETLVERFKALSHDALQANSQSFLEYARAHGITQIFVGHNLRRGWRNRLGGTPLDRLIRDAEGIDVRVFPQ